MAGNEHLIFAEETAFGTWVTPNKALPVRTASLTGTQPLMDAEVTGGGRNDRPGAIGEVAVSGPVNTLLYPTVLPFLLRSVFPTRASTAAGTTGTRNKLLIDDDVAQDSFSIQKRYDATRAESLRGCKLTRFTISARAREFAQCQMEFVGKDSVMSGGTWADGSAAPAVVDPVPYAVGMPQAFTFYQGVLRLGGTVTLTSGEIVVTGGTDRVDVDNIELTVETNIGSDAYGVNIGDRTIQTADEGARRISLRFDPNWALSGTTFYNAWKAGAQAVVELYFIGPEFEAGQAYISKWTVPYVMYQDPGLPELNRTFGLKRHSIQGRGYTDPTILNDLGWVQQSTEDLAA
jgi:hypothetical protein